MTGLDQILLAVIVLLVLLLIAVTAYACRPTTAEMRAPEEDESS